jgi:4-alpha-glucanotransferase
VNLADRVTHLEVEQAVTAMYAELARSRSRLALATLDDLLGVPVRPNIPGTIDEHPNWRIPLPVPLRNIFERTLARRVLSILAAERGIRHAAPAANGASLAA